jgi:hypothetical protein
MMWHIPNWEEWNLVILGNMVAGLAPDATSECTTIMTRSQFFEGLKEESQIEDNGKREGVGARFLTRSTRGVEGRVGAPRLD